MVQVSEQLIDDHTEVDKISKRLQTALESGDLEVAHDKLDLFWARLAVHIRAEHLHLFPTVLRSVESSVMHHPSAPSLIEAESVVAELRHDHEFFMHQLALAVEIMRKLLTSPDHLITERLNEVKKIVLGVEVRLAGHNELEENQIYHWATTLLSSEEQAKLATLITTQLQNRPSRFSLGAWSNE